MIRDYEITTDEEQKLKSENKIYKVTKNTMRDTQSDNDAEKNYKRKSCADKLSLLQLRIQVSRAGLTLHQ